MTRNYRRLETWSRLVQEQQSVNLLTGQNALNEYASLPTILIIQGLRVGGQRESERQRDTERERERERESEGARARERKRANRRASSLWHCHSALCSLQILCLMLTFTPPLFSFSWHLLPIGPEVLDFQWREWLKRDIPWFKPII